MVSRSSSSGNGGWIIIVAYFSFLPLSWSCGHKAHTICRGHDSGEGRDMDGYSLPVKVVDVICVVNEGQAEQDVYPKIGIIFDGVVAQASSGELVANCARDLAGGQ